MRVNVDGRVSGVVEGQDPIEVRHSITLPVLILLGAIVIAATIAATRPVTERYGLIGCNRNARLCTRFDGATGELGLVPLPLYPGEASNVAPRPKQEV